MGLQILADVVGFRGRATAPRCASRECDRAAAWSGALRVWGENGDRSGPPLVEVRFPLVCSPCTIAHVHDHVAGDAFWGLVSEMARAGFLPPPDRSSLESEFSAL